MRTKPNNFYVAKLVEPYCHCDAHLYDPQMTRYKKLADKERLLHDELSELNQQVRNYKPRAERQKIATIMLHLQKTTYLIMREKKKP